MVSSWLSAIMASTCAVSTRFIMCVNSLTGRAHQRRFGFVPVRDRIAEQFAGLRCKLGSTGAR